MNETQAKLKEMFAALQKEREAVLKVVDPLRAQRDKLASTLAPIEAKMRELANAMKPHKAKLAELDYQLSALSKALGGKQLGG